jgi:hypothetical protein
VHYNHALLIWVIDLSHSPFLCREKFGMTETLFKHKQAPPPIMLEKFKRESKLWVLAGTNNHCLLQRYSAVLMKLQEDRNIVFRGHR